jgi:flagellar basal body-associated protein FliL
MLQTTPQEKQIRWWILIVGVVLLLGALALPPLITSKEGYPPFSSVAGIAIVVAIVVGIACIVRFLLDVIAASDHRSDRSQL